MIPKFDTMKKFFLRIFLMTVCYSSASGQMHSPDSILKLIDHDREDTLKVKHLANVSKVYCLIGDKKNAIEYAGRAIELAKQLNFTKGLGISYMAMAFGYWMNDNSPEVVGYFSKALEKFKEIDDKPNEAKAISNMGLYYFETGDYNKAYEDYSVALKNYEDVGNKNGIAINSTNLGNLFATQGNYPKALESYLRALKMDVAIGDSSGVAIDYGTIGDLYGKLHDTANALQYNNRALHIYKDQSDSDGIARTLGNIGMVYDEVENYNIALVYEMEALKIYRSLGINSGIYTNIGNIGSVYEKKKDYADALIYYNQALDMAKEAKDKVSIVRNLGNIGEVFVNEKDFIKAEDYFKQAIEIAKEVNYAEALRDFNIDLSDAYAKSGEWQKAYEAFVKGSAANDSMVSADKSKEIGKIEAKADYDKQLAVQQAEEDKKAVLAAAESKRQKIIIGFSITIVVIVAFIALVILRSLRLTRKQKKLIEEQKNEVESQKNLVEKQKDIVEHQKLLVEEKNKEITDSITYAKRLQDAILPRINEINAFLPQSFVLYKPKDIVAGDFYWFEHAGETILIAACDCTGHGVPGALVSVVCSNALNRAVKEFEIADPGKILDKVRELVLETFEKSESQVQDGMDISLAAITPSEGGITVRWAGAYNSLWYTEKNELKEIIGDKQPIGKTDNPKPFTTHTIQIPLMGGQRGGATLLYLFTDGYADQFGGEKGKKYKYQQLSQKLKSISAEPMNVQKETLDKEFEYWKGSLEQTDDVCMIGIRL